MSRIREAFRAAHKDRRAVFISYFTAGDPTVERVPELATALVAAVRKESDIAVGNIIGSNVFNIAAILGITSTVEPIRVVSNVMREELPAIEKIYLDARESRRKSFQTLSDAEEGAP